MTDPEGVAPGASPEGAPETGAAGALIQALIEESACRRCKGQKKIYQRCGDPQCGDSTWDHECDEGYEPCPDCGATGKGPAARAAMSRAPACEPKASDP